jgi:hypothetical protein
MDFVTMLMPLLGLAFLIERIVESVWNVIEKVFAKQIGIQELAKNKSETSAHAQAAALVAQSAAATAADDPAAAKKAADEAAEAKVAADKASAAAALKAANYASWKQILTMIVSIVLGVYLANEFKVPLVTMAAASDVTLPAFLNNYLFAGLVAGAISPFAHQILESLLNFQKLLEEQKKHIAGDVSVGE